MASIRFPFLLKTAEQRFNASVESIIIGVTDSKNKKKDDSSYLI